MNIGAYIQGAIVTGVLAGAVLSIFPSTGGSGRYVRYAAQLLMLLVLVSPISAVIGSLSCGENLLPQYEVGDSSFESDAVAYSASSISRAICEHCADRFSLEESEIGVKLILNEEKSDDVRLDELQLYLNERDSAKRESVREYFEDLLNARVFVFGP